MLYSLPANTFMNLPLRSALGTSKFSFTSVWTGEGSGAELGVPGDVEGQLLVAGAPLQVPVDAVVSPPGVLADGGHLEVSTVWGVEVHVRQLAHAPVHVEVELRLSAIKVDVHLVVQQEVGAVPPVLPGDRGGEGLAIGEGLGGGEPLVGHGEVSLAQLLAVPGDLTLVAAASLGNLEPLELGSGMVDLHLEGGAGLVVEVHVHLLHARAELAEKGGQEHVELVRLLVGGDQHVGNIASILVDLGLGVELVHHNILVLFVPEELKLAVPLGEGSEDPVLADDHLVEEGLGVQLKVALKPDLQLVSIIHLGGDGVVLPHHGAALGGHDVNVPSAGASVGRLFGVQLHASSNVGVDDQEASPLVVDGHGERVLGNVEPLEEVGGAGAELVGGVHGVAGDVDDLVAVLHNVEVDLELAQQEVPVVSVDEELEVVGPGLESAEGIVVLDELVQLGGGVEGHLGVGLPHDGVGVGLVLPQGLIGPHGLAVLGGLDLDGSAQVQFNLKLVWRSLKGELVVLVVGLEVSLGNLAAHDGILAPQSELGALHLNLALQLNNALRTLLDVDDNVGLIRSTLHTDLTVVLDSPDVSLDDDVHVLAGPVEGALDG